MHTAASLSQSRPNLFPVPGRPSPAARSALLRVAVVEDDPSQRQLLSNWLKLAGHQCFHFEGGEELMDAFLKERFDVLMLDWQVPGMNGVDVLKHIRNSHRASLPVLFLSARNSEEDVVTALRQGADDYVIKPVRRLELIARLEALARRGEHFRNDVEVRELDVFRIDSRSRTLLRNGNPIDLTPKDFDLSNLFLRNVGSLLSRSRIRDTVWGRQAGVSSRTLDTHVSRIRSSLGLIPRHGWHLVAVYGHGYRLVQLRAPQETVIES
jgi:DNA-binding response OmpR family regulator